MKTYELTVVGKRFVTIPDDVDISDYIDAIINGNGSDVVDGGYDTYGELLDDMEYEPIGYEQY